MCAGRGRVMENSLGRFSYFSVPVSVFSAGLTIEMADNHHFRLAGYEKAVCDKVLLTQHLKAIGRSSMQSFLFDDLRIDADLLQSFDFTVLQVEASGYKPRQFNALRQVLESLV